MEEEENVRYSHQSGLPTSDLTDSGRKEREVLQIVIDSLSTVSIDARRRIVETVCTFLGIHQQQDYRSPNPATSTAPKTSSQPKHLAIDLTISPKQFMADKSPYTDVERVACLAYFLAHIRGTPHFKTRDITDLNTEAAQRRFSNTGVAVENAAKLGYLVPSTKGLKQISAIGERFVDALPDREAADLIKTSLRMKRSPAKGRNNKRIDVK